MKYSEANKKLKGWDASIEFSEIFTLGKRCVVLGRLGSTILSMKEGSQRVTVNCQPQRTVPYEAIRLLHALNETPAKKRRDEKKYYIKVASIDGGLYLNYVKEEKNFTFSTKNEIATHQTQFTKQEVNSWLKATTLAIDWDKALEEVPRDEVSDD